MTQCEDPGEGRAAGAEASAVEERLAAILDHAADAIIVIDEKGAIENSNLAATRLFGWAEGDLRGQPLEVLMGEVDRAGHSGHMARYLNTGRSGILNVGPRTLEARRRDGTPVPIELSVGEAWIGGQRKFIGACRDISQRLASDAALTETVAALNRTVADLKASGAALERERRQSEAWARAAEAARAEAEAANLAKSRFLATMSHEIRTPLNGVIAIADVLAGRVTAAEDRDLVGIVRESGRTLLALLNEILDLAKIEAGAFTLAAAPFSPGDLINALAVTWRCAASAKGLDLQVDAGGLPPVVGDEGRLRQVISNLLSNAIKFTERGSVSIRCECEAIEDGQARLLLVVADTGQGFDAALAERIFDPFVQADSTNTRRHGGTGLGLAICRDLIRLMGGEISAESAPNLGARMTIRLALPLAQARAGQVPAQTPPPEPALAGDEAGPRILVAEDHPLNRRIMAVLLDEMGLAHEMVEDGAAAVRAVAGGRYDLVLMDLQMPGMDGLEATRAIRRLPGAAGRIPVVAVTADAMSDHADSCRAAGMDGFIAKPIQPAQLQRLLLEQLSPSPERIAS
ncbi:MAG: ATP-binding protein [Caulobacteraceae bacterium]|nr:ATP-binding protein [Caulobacteraceae bacterium]